MSGMFESQAGVGVSDGAVNPIGSLPLLLSLPTVKIMLPHEYNHPPLLDVGTQRLREAVLSSRPHSR